MATVDEVLRGFYTKKASGKTGIPSPADYYKGQLFAEAGNAQNKRRNELDRANLATAQQAVEAQRAFNNQSLADAELNRQAQEKAQQMQTLTNLGGTALTAYGLSGSTMIGDAVKTGVQSVAPSVAEYLGLQTAAQKAASVIPKVAVDAASTAGTEAVTQGLSSAGANTAAQGAAQVGSAVGDTMGVTTGEVIKGAASSVGSTVGNVAGKVAVPLAIIGAANMARNQWGEPKRKWYGEDSKTASAKFFDDPGMGLGANIPDAIFGSNSEWSRVPNQVGEQFSHYAGGPIGKAFNLDFKGAAEELSNAPYTTLQSFGVDKGTSEAANATLNAPGYAYSQWAEGDSGPGLNFLGAPDPVTGSLSTALSNSGLGTVGNIASAALNPVGALVEAIGGGCIIVTACTDRHSSEVEITRKYRDKFLDADQIRGYYILAEKVVPCLERSDRMRKIVKRCLVDRLIDYGSYRLGIKTERPRILSYIVSKSFLATIKAIGAIIPRYERINGEVY